MDTDKRPDFEPNTDPLDGAAEGIPDFGGDPEYTEEVE